MKKFSPAFVLLISSFVILLFACKKINEATTLGSDLIPPIDNINTFEKFLDIETKNIPLDSTTVAERLLYQDQVALGAMNDPEFGRTQTDVYFRISSVTYGGYPFNVTKTFANNPDSLIIDSVVLSLSYQGVYGDTNSFQTVRVYEIAANAKFNDTTLYKFIDNDPLNFPTSPIELGSKSFFIKNLNDTVPFRRKAADSLAKTVNTLRIKFHPSEAENLGRRFANFDTTAGGTNSGFRSDTIFKKLFKGLAVKADQSVDQGGLPYFNLAANDTRMIIYYRGTKNGKVDTSSVEFIHSTNGQANIIRRTPSNGYANYLANGLGDKIYLQTTPGSYVSMKIPALDTFSNKVIHRAEIIATQVDITPTDNIFYPPSRLIIDRINRTGDTAFLLYNDLAPNFDGTLNYDVFGGTLKYGSYNFNISRHVQGIITRHEPNDTLRMYAPLRTILFASNLNSKISVPVINRIAEGRVKLGGGTYPDLSKRLRLRIIYSNL